jgi:glycosyltransferase involved in cell wall biosynthesis
MIDVKDVTIVIPCMNEEKTILSLYQRFSKEGYRVLVPIAKKSKDRTTEVCEKNNIQHFLDNGQGKGAALKEAIEKVSTHYLLFIDADGSHDFEDIQPMIAEMGRSNADMVIGSRLKGGSMELYDGTLESFCRSMFTLGINQIVNIRFGSRITDTQNGFRGGKTESFRKLNLKSKTFEVETEMVMKMLKKGMRISEIPAREYAREYGSSGVSILRHGWRYIFTVMVNLF